MTEDSEPREEQPLKKVVLDTNVLLDRPFETIFESFKEPTEVVIPLVVLEELDTFKNGHAARHEYARAATRFLDALRKEGKLHEGVLYKEHKVVVDVSHDDLDLDKPDYKIIRTAYDSGSILITQDINERVVADALGVEATNFAPNDVDVNKLYTGYREIDITDEEVEAFYKNDEFNPGTRRLYNNQFLIMTDDLGGIHLGIYKASKRKVVKLLPKYEAWGIKPKKNKRGVTVIEQIFAMHLLLDTDVQFVSLLGPSGTGKTLLTLAAALQQVMRSDEYNKIMVMRPLVAVGDDIGYLPGDKLEKLEPWMASTFDALDFLLEKDYDKKDGGFYTSSKEKIYDLIHIGKLELEAMAHVRGRSIPQQFIIIDDAQNLTQHQATTIITRAAEGTKVVFLGDLSEKQIDNHRLTPSSNGLAYVIDRFKGEEIVGHVTMKEVVRSPLAQLGVDKL